TQTVESMSLSNKKTEHHFSSQKNSKSERFNHLKDHFDNKYLEGSFNSNIKFNFGKLQPKLKVSQPGDPYEQEADRLAEQVMNMSAPSKTDTSFLITTDNENKVRRQCSSCEEKRRRLKGDEEELSLKENERELTIRRNASDK